MKITLEFNPLDDWLPTPWEVHKVVPIYDDDGDVIAYVEGDYIRDRVGIPTELFNHAMKEVDPTSPIGFAEFMSEYGLLGLRPRCPMALTLRNVFIKESPVQIDYRYRFDRGYNKHSDDGLWRENDLNNWYQQVLKGLGEAGLGRRISATVLDYGVDTSMLVTAKEATDTFRYLMETAEIAKALKQTDNPERIAQLLKLDEADEQGLADYLVWHMRDLDDLVSHIVSPRIRIRYMDGDKPLPPPVSEEYADDLEQDVEEGNLAQAIALQIYKFSIKDKYHFCKECGTVFCERDSKSRKGTPRKTAEFCSDKCANVYRQRMHRERRQAKKDSAIAKQEAPTKQ